jgi:hypothetical protein
MALLADNLERIDGQHIAAYLESSNPANDARYERVGFVRISQFATPGSPSVATMWRDSRGGRTGGAPSATMGDRRSWRALPKSRLALARCCASDLSLGHLPEIEHYA